MVGNVNSIVESMFAADNVRNQQSTASQTTTKFSDYLDSALLNYRTGLLTGGLGSNYSYMNALTGSSWQTVVLEALRDELKKNQKSEESSETQQENTETSSQTAQKKKTDWATIRVIQHYRSPVLEAEAENRGIVV